jgi:glycosyltransferase involved in cell wall biosynthesis
MSGAAAGVQRSAGPLATLAAVPGAVGVVRRLAKLARGFDVLYTNTQKAWVLGSAAAKLAGRPAVMHLHDILTADHFSNLNRKLAVGTANRLAAAVIANSRATADAFADAGGRVEPTAVVFNGIDGDAYAAPLDRPATAVWRDVGAHVTDDTPVLALFGRLSPWKGQHVAIDALSQMDHPAHLVLVGEALFGEDDYAASLRRQVGELGLSDRVHLVGFRDDVPRLMQAADVVLHCSTAPEPFGRVIVEAMLSGTPIVAADAGGPREIVDDGRTGVLVTPDDAAALARRLDDLLADPPGLAAMADRACAEAQQRFTLGPIVEQITDVLRDVVQADDGPRPAISAPSTPV